jgi:hypothetical protein
VINQLTPKINLKNLTDLSIQLKWKHQLRILPNKAKNHQIKFKTIKQSHKLQQEAPEKEPLR